MLVRGTALPRLFLEFYVRLASIILACIETSRCASLESYTLSPHLHLELCAISSRSRGISSKLQVLNPKPSAGARRGELAATRRRRRQSWVWSRRFDVGATQRGSVQGDIEVYEVHIPGMEGYQGQGPILVAHALYF